MRSRCEACEEPRSGPSVSLSICGGQWPRVWESGHRWRSAWPVTVVSVSEKAQLQREPEGQNRSLFDLLHSNGNDNDLRHLLLCPNMNVGFLNGELVPSPPLLATASHAQTFTDVSTWTAAKNNCIRGFSKILTSLKNRQLYWFH